MWGVAAVAGRPPHRTGGVVDQLSVCSGGVAGYGMAGVAGQGLLLVWTVAIVAELSGCKFIFRPLAQDLEQLGGRRDRVA